MHPACQRQSRGENSCGDCSHHPVLRIIGEANRYLLSLDAYKALCRESGSEFDIKRINDSLMLLDMKVKYKMIHILKVYTLTHLVGVYMDI